MWVWFKNTCACTLRLVLIIPQYKYNVVIIQVHTSVINYDTVKVNVV